jgi:hypothetical protein
LEPDIEKKTQRQRDKQTERDTEVSRKTEKYRTRQRKAEVDIRRETGRSIYIQEDRSRKREKRGKI